LRFDGTAAQIAIGAIVPAGTEAVIRIEDSATTDGLITGTPRPKREWRHIGEDACAGEVVVPAGAAVSPATVCRDRGACRPEPLPAADHGPARRQHHFEPHDRAGDGLGLGSPRGSPPRLGAC